MNAEFPDICQQLIQDAVERIHKEAAMKVDAIRECEMEQAKQKSDLRSKLSAIFLSGLHKTMREVQDKKDQDDTVSNNNYGPNNHNPLQKKQTMMERSKYLKRGSKMRNQFVGLNSNINVNGNTPNNNKNNSTLKKQLGSEAHATSYKNKSSFQTDDEMKHINDAGHSFVGNNPSVGNFGGGEGGGGGSRIQFGESYTGQVTRNTQGAGGLGQNQQSLQKAKVSFKVESEMVSEDDGDDLDGMSGPENVHQGGGQRAQFQKSGQPFQSSPSVFGGGDYSDEDEDEDYGMEEIDSEISDENLLMFYEIRQAIIMLNKKTDRISNIVK